MKRTRVISAGSLGIVVCALMFGGVATSLMGQGQPGAANAALATEAEFQQTVMPVLAKNCVGCHSDRLHSGNLSLEQFREPAAALGKPDVWQKVLDKVTAGQMPPKPAAPLAGADLAAVTGWIRKLPGVSETSASAGPVNPGRVTARRLNRTEYNNTIRDLLGVAARPADEFPVDDSGYGFDNNSDVLSVSPLLMENTFKRRRTSHAGGYGETLPPKPGLIVACSTAVRRITTTC
jgi:mono/diheme cytochrome c family protein